MAVATVKFGGFPARLRALREQNGLSQEDLGRLCGYPLSTAQRRIGYWEQGMRDPGHDDVQLLAKALDTTPSFLYFGTEKPASSLPLMVWSDMSKPAKRSTHRIHIFWPMQVSAEAFVTTLPDDSMAPMFMQGEMWVIDPSAAPKAGDVVIVANRKQAQTVCLVGSDGHRLVFKGLDGKSIQVGSKRSANRLIGVRRFRIISDG